MLLHCSDIQHPLGQMRLRNLLSELSHGAFSTTLNQSVLQKSSLILEVAVFNLTFQIARLADMKPVFYSLVASTVNVSNAEKRLRYLSLLQ